MNEMRANSSATHPSSPERLEMKEAETRTAAQNVAQPHRGTGFEHSSSSPLPDVTIASALASVSLYV